jgi:3-dehydroquinate dehydratase/shikimate dehydrogenase
MIHFPTKLTIPITASSVVQAIQDIRAAAEAGADLAEMRLDYLASVDYAAIINNSPLPILWTLRHASEGGKFTGSVEEQIEQLTAAVETGGAYVDIEYRRWLAAGPAGAKLAERVSKKKAKLILSAHNFKETPGDIVSLGKEIEKVPCCDVVKIACMAEAITDNFLIFDAVRQIRKPMVGITMGPLGAMSRVLAKKLGMELTFASLGQEKASAPGQLTVGQMKEEFNWDALGPETRLAGVIGHPVEHSLSPDMHNRAYRSMGLDGVYLKFDVAELYEAFAGFIDGLRRRPWLNCMGLSITIPHKTNAIRYLRENKGIIDPLAEKIGAVNTLVFGLDGSMSGYNTDYVGVLETLRVSGGLDKGALEGKKAAVLGGGGVVRAIVAARTSVGAEVTIFNRTESKARDLAKDFGCQWKPWEERNSAGADIVVNGTSLGMHPNVEGCPLEASGIRPGMIVFDTVYNPLNTKLLRSTMDAGGLGLTGADMLVFQAVEQIKLWLSGQQMREIPIPADIMKQAMMAKLQR